MQRRREELLKRDLEQLKRALETNGMGYLLDAMESKALYSPRINRSDSGYESSEQVSWYATRHAEQLTAEADKVALLQELGRDPSTTRRGRICFALAHLCSNTSDVQLYAYLTELLETEPDADVRISTFIGLERLDKRGLDVDFLVDVAVNGTDNESPNAIFALKGTDPARTEDVLIDIIRYGTGRALYAGCSVLGEVGTTKCLEDLEKVKRRSRDASLRWAIDRSVTAIKARTQ